MRGGLVFCRAGRGPGLWAGLPGFVGARSVTILGLICAGRVPRAREGYDTQTGFHGVIVRGLLRPDHPGPLAGLLIFHGVVFAVGH